MNEMSVEKWWNEIYGREKREKPRENLIQTPFRVDPGGPVIIRLATGSEVRGFKSGRGRWIFQSVKILNMFLWKYLKPKLEPLSKICQIFHAHCRKRR